MVSSLILSLIVKDFLYLTMFTPHTKSKTVFYTDIFLSKYMKMSCDQVQTKVSGIFQFRAGKLNAVGETFHFNRLKEPAKVG